MNKHEVLKEALERHIASSSEYDQPELLIDDFIDRTITAMHNLMDDKGVMPDYSIYHLTRMADYLNHLTEIRSSLDNTSRDSQFFEDLDLIRMRHNNAG